MQSFRFELANALNPWYDPHTMNDIYNSGYLAFQEGLELSDNPYDFGNDNYDAWESGWVLAADEDNHVGR